MLFSLLSPMLKARKGQIYGCCVTILSTSSLFGSRCDVITYYIFSIRPMPFSGSLYSHKKLYSQMNVLQTHNLLNFSCVLNQTFATIWTQLHASEIPHFLSLLLVLKKELEDVIQCRRLIKPKTIKVTSQESQFCKDLKVTLSQPYCGLEGKDE